MCGRYYFDPDEVYELKQIIDELNRRFSGAELSPYRMGEVSPSNVAPVIAQEGVELMTWGFPKFNGPGVIFNTRSETAAVKPMFRSALARGRIVVPTSGFYEWRQREGSRLKDKFFFRKADEKVLYLAGIYNLFESRGQKQARFTVLTTDANESVAPYHHRMPVILAPDERDAWLNNDGRTDEFLSRIPPALVANKS